jgi:branched-subunit amino acid transport protein
VAQLFSLGGSTIMKRSIIIFAALLFVGIIAFAAFWVGHVLGSAEGTVMMKEYERDVHEIVTVVDELATAGRTNDVHQVCQNFQGIYMMRRSDTTNLDWVITDAESRVSKQPFTRLPK